MALSTIDPKPALVIIDLQKGLSAIPMAHRMADIVQRSATLAAAFRKHTLPVVLVNVDGRAPGRTEMTGANRIEASPNPDWTAIIDELGPQPEDLRITKQRAGAFHGTGLDMRLRDLGVTQIVLTGIATTMGVESTARAAHEHGYHVVLATDAMTDRDADAHHNSITRVFPRLGETTTTTTDILDMLEKTHG